MKTNVFKIDTDVTQSGAHVLQAGQDTKFSFGPEDIKGITMHADGSLVISFNEGGELTIKNFESLSNSGTTLTLADDTVIEPTLANLAAKKIDAVHADNDNHMLIDIPSEGIVREITLEPGQQYILNFAMEDVAEAKANVDGSYVLSFKNGAQLVLSNYDEAMEWDNHPIISADPFITTASNDALLTNIERLVFAQNEKAEEDKAETTKVAKADIDAAELANIETAAGDEAAPADESVEDLAALADALAEVEPAAGETAAASSNSGYGFNSTAASVSLDGKSAIGALGRTQLNYNAGGAGDDLGAKIFAAPMAIDDVPEFLTGDGGGAIQNVDEGSLTGGPLVANGIVVVNYGVDAPGAILPNGVFNATGSVATGNLSSDGVPVMMTMVAGGYDGEANGQLVFSFRIDPSTGEYTFTQYLPLDHADGTDANDEITLEFGIVARDNDGDQTAGSVKIIVADDAPVAHSAAVGLDESDISPAIATGSVVFNYGADADGTLTTSGVFSATGSVGTQLTSGGVPVTVTPTATGYIGMAGTTAVFTLHLNLNTGEYTYTQLAPLDHADSDDADDVITLNFGVTATDGDGDTATVAIRIDVKDDAPIAMDETGTAIEDQVVTGDLMANDTLSVDGNVISQVSFNGAIHAVPAGGSITVVGTYGVLTVHSTGAYSYTANHNNPDGTDTFTYTLRDGDGDTDTANLSIKVSPIDDVPEVDISSPNLNRTVDESDLGVVQTSGSIQANFGTDGPGTYQANDTFNASGSMTGGTLSHNGHAIDVNLVGRTYIGTANGETIFTMQFNELGEYTFTLYKSLDHADGNDANDSIALQFGFTAMDADDDTVDSFVTVNVLDDGPVTVADEVFMDLDTYTASGNLMANDDVGADGGSITKITFNGVDYDVPATGNLTVNSAHGTLVVNAAGDYTYTLTDMNAPTVTENFGYTLTDGDGDTAVSNTGLSIEIESRDDTPVLVKPSIGTVDEDFIGGAGASVNGQLQANFYDDGNGGFGGTGTFSSNGSQLGGALTHHGIPVDVAFDALTNTYTGTAGGETIFTLTIAADGSYAFKLLGTLDHADPDDPNDIIHLHFGVKATDLDGDVGTNTIRIDVKDDVPSFGPAAGSVDESALDQGPIVLKDSLDANVMEVGSTVAPGGGSFSYGPTLTAPPGTGGPANVPALSSGGVAVSVTATANGYVGMANGTTIFTLTIDAATGKYTYTQMAALDHGDASDVNDILSLHFPITLTTSEGETVNSTITVNVADDAGVARADLNGAEEDQLITGDVIANDFISADGGSVTSVLFNGQVYGIPAGGSVSINGQFGTLVMKSDGTYTYQATAEDPDGTEVFTYTLTDGDGDASSATLSIRVTPDGEPVAVNANFDVDESNLLNGELTFNGDLDIDFGTNGAGTVTVTNTFEASGSMAGGQLTSNGLPVSVALVGGAYVGTAGGKTIFTLSVQNDGSYTFKLMDTLDHGSINDPNDLIKLEFGVRASDPDGDYVDGTVTIHVHDDAPVARADINGVEEDDMVTGDVLGNDVLSKDGVNSVTAVVFNGVSHNIPTDGTVSINGQFGTLVMKSDGTYTYQATADNPDGVEVFTYTLRDGDGDTNIATLSITVTPDGVPVAVAGSFDVDETNMAGGHVSFDGQLLINFGADGAGSVLGNSQFSASGSLSGGQLTSGGQPVTVTMVGGVYVGSAGGQPVFTLSINNDGSYNFKLMGALDHANAQDTNDVIRLTFGVRASDADGDSVDGVININVHDDAPVAIDDVFTATAPRSEPPPPPPPPAPDDAPIARADSYTFLETAMINGRISNSPGGGNVTSGNGVVLNVLANDKMSLDGGNKIVSAIFVDKNGNTITTVAGSNGTQIKIGSATYTVTVAADGQTLHLKADRADGGGTDEVMYIKYTLRDADGDESSAIATVTQDDNTSPLVLDLDGDGIELVNVTAGIRFDMGSDGTLDNTSWVGKDDGLLVIDKDGNGKIDNQSELFGTSETDGFSVLAQYDSNGDGKITNADALWNKLQVWQDKNQDGISQADELKSLTQLGITSINLGAAETGTWIGDSFISHESTFTWSNGTTGKVVDAWFNVDNGDAGVNVEGTTYDMPDNAPAGAVVGNVLANDIASADKGMTIVTVTVGGVLHAVAASGSTVINGQHGKLTIWSNGAFFYEPNGTNQSAAVETFTYAVRDGDGDRNSANLKINIEAMDDVPVAVDDNYTYTPPANLGPDAKFDQYTNVYEYASKGTKGTSVGTTLSGTPEVIDFKSYEDGKSSIVTWKLPILTNDTDPEGNPLTITSISNIKGLDTGGGYGAYRLEIAPDGKSVYLITHMDGDGKGTVVTFDYTISDGRGGTDTASVSVSVTDNNSPLVLDLDGDGVELVNMSAGIKFDMNSDGTLNNTSWVGKDDGFLVLDKNNNGKIDNQSELFGTNSRMGFDVLADYDSNGDGKIDNRDAIWSKLQVWQDKNQDGISQSSELKTLSQMGISSINLAGVQENGSWIGDSFISHGSTFTWTNGKTGQIVDAWFTTDEGSPIPPNSSIENVGSLVKGNVLANDTMSADGGNRVTSITIGTVTHTIPATGTITIDGQFGKLTIGATGHFTYAPSGSNTTAVIDTFRYTLADADGDSSQANLNINLPAFKPDDAPIARADTYNFLETQMIGGSGVTLNVLSNDKMSADGGNRITKAVFVDAAGKELGATVGVYNGTVGTAATGDLRVYTVTINNGGQSLQLKGTMDLSSKDEVFYIKYTLTDADGDSTTAIATVKQQDNTSPLVLDLDGDGVELVHVDNGVMFDIDNDGTSEKTGWVGKDDGLLVLDKNKDGVINDQNELFGNNAAHDDGFANLASYDSNADGVIDINDAIFGDLRVWKDGNSDGFSDEGELLTLAQIGIVSLNLTTAQPEGLYIEGNWISHIGSFTMADGTVHQIVDAWFTHNEVQITDLYGSEYADNFLFQTIEESAVTLHDFNVLEGDALDLSVLLDGQDGVTEAINEFVHSRTENGSTIISVDLDGAGAGAAVDIVKIDGVTGLDVQEMLNNGNLIV